MSTCRQKLDLPHRASTASKQKSMLVPHTLKLWGAVYSRTDTTPVPMVTANHDGMKLRTTCVL